MDWYDDSVNTSTPIVKFYEAGRISGRAYKVCEYNDIHTLFDLICIKYKDDLLKLKKCGKKTAKELENLVSVNLKKSGITESFFSKEYPHLTEEKDDAIITTSIIKYYQEGMISARAYNICIYNDIETLADLIQFHQSVGLISLRNCGKKTVEELERLIETIDYNQLIEPFKQLNQYKDIPEPIRTIIEEIYNTPLEGFSTESASVFHSTFKTPVSFYLFFCHNMYELHIRLLTIKDIGLKRYCFQLLKDICFLIRKANLTQVKEFELLVAAKTTLLFYDDSQKDTIEDVDRIEGIKKLFYQTNYNERVEKLSSRARTVLKTKIPAYKDAIALFELTEKQFYDTIFAGKLIGMTTNEVYDFIDELKNELVRNEGIGDEDFTKKVVSNKYDYMTEEQVAFIIDCYIQNGQYPMFFNLVQHLKQTKNKQEMMLAMLTGVYDGRFWKVVDIAKKFGCEVSSVEYALKTASKGLFEDKGWRRYGFAESDVVTQDDERYKEIVVKEKADITFENFVRICSRGFSMGIVCANSSFFLVNKRFDSRLINRICKQLGQQNTERRIKTVYYPIQTLLKNVVANKRKEYEQLLSIIIREAYGLEVDREGNIVLPKNEADLFDELYKILRKKGSPMSLAEMFVELKKRLPEIKYDEPKQIKSYILRSNRIKPIGLTGTYALTEWDDVYLGSIRDLVAEILTGANKPMHLDDIMPIVLQFYPETNSRSVSSSIRNSERFVSFGFGYFGIAEKKYSDFVTKKKQASGATTESTRSKHIVKAKDGQKGNASDGATHEKTNNSENKQNPQKKKRIQQDETQVEFQRRCRQLLDFVIAHSFPTRETNRYLYDWFQNTNDNISTLEESKREYFEGMLVVLRKWGMNL